MSRYRECKTGIYVHDGGKGRREKGWTRRAGEAKCFLASSRRLAFREGDP